MTTLKTGFLRALVVDDGRISRSQMHDMLKKAGFRHLDEAENAAAAAAKMEALPFDIVFLDWLMPGKSGIALLEEWRQDRRYDDVAVIVVSAESDARMIAGARKAGALSYIVKPVTDKVLREHVGEAVKWLEQRRKFRDEQRDHGDNVVRDRGDNVVVPITGRGDGKKR